MAVLLANGVMKKRLTLVVRRFRWLEDNAVEPYRFVIIDDFIKRQFNLLAPFTSPAESVSTKFLAPPFS